MSVRRKALCFTMVAGMGLGVSSCTHSTHSLATQQDKMQAPEFSDASTSEEAGIAPAGGDALAMGMAEAHAPAPLPVTEQMLGEAGQGVSFKMLESGDAATLLIDAPQASSVETLVLENPSRFVVDLYGQGVTSNNTVPVEHALVSALRVGKHQDKTRIVIDLNEAMSPSTVTEDGQVRIALRGNAIVAGDAGAAMAAVEPVSTESVALGLAPVEAALPSIDAQASIEAQSGIVELTELQFERGWEDSGVVTLSLSEQSAFELKQSAPSEYVLTLPRATALKSAMSPRIAPRGFPGIRAARAVESEGSVEVRMFVDAGVALTAKPNGNLIKVEASSVLPAKDPSARAQPQMLELEEVDGGLPREAAAPPAEGEEMPAEEMSDEDVARQNPTGVPSTDGSRIYTGRLISLDLQDTDIDNALRIIAEVSNLNIIASDDVSGKVTLRLIDVPWDQALDVILKTNGLDQVVEGNVIRIAPVDKLRQEREALREAKRAQQSLEDLKVEYVRVSYARVDELREQVEAVVSERGTVAVDERTNQLIIKDIQVGQKAARELISRLDLRTPQVLLETQIVEGQRNMLRDLGFQWNYNYIASPATGNATGYNFPNSIVAGGGTSDEPGNPWAVNFPAALEAAGGSAVTAVLDSADGSRSLAARMSALENEGRVRVVSRPQVATVNNKQAEIKSVETIRVRVPGAGTSIATGAGANAAGGGATAFEEIDVGIELRVTPQASPDYYVLLDIEARSSALGSEQVDNIPSTIEREATSTILVKSGQTFALGGVYRISDTDGITGVPWLKDIPFLGWLFRRQLVDKSDEELIFFITPHIVEGSFDPSIM